MNRVLSAAQPFSLRDVVYVAGGSLAVALAAQVSFPLPWTPVPVTLQPLAVMLVGAFLGPWRGAAAMFLYLLEGAAGLPVFTPMGAPGLARILGPTGGYLLSYPLAAYTIGTLANAGWTRTFKRAMPAFFGTSLIILTFGASWMVLAGARSVSEALYLAVLPFLPWDIAKVFVAATLTSGVRKYRQ